MPVKKNDLPLLIHFIFVPAGQSTRWKSFSIIQHVSGIFRIPCRFDLRKYPFADQQCELHLLIEGSVDTGLTFEKYPTAAKKGKVSFYGRRDVGEYQVQETLAKEFRGNTTVALVIKFSPYYGYHLLNSFLTSLLILLISFATFFFRIDDFNERIMVSLTALLVLTALFTQANYASLNTPYLKLFDIWYAVLIICTFLNVVANTALNAYLHKLKSQLPDKTDNLGSILVKISCMNKVFFGVLAGSFGIFLLFFILAAANAI